LFSYYVYEKGRKTYKSAYITRATFDGLKAGDLGSHLRRAGVDSFQTLRKNEIRRIENQIVNLTLEIKAQSQRFNTWKKTHQWNPGTETWDKV
jgi:hypothetical protein